MLLSRRNTMAGLATAASLHGHAIGAESTAMRIASLEGFGFLPFFIALDQGLVEKHAAERGLPGLAVENVPLRSAVAATDALLAGRLDVIVGTITTTLILWDKTGGGVKILAPLGGQVFTMVTRNPSIHSIADFGPTDRIAVPSVKQGPHSVVIGMALDKALGPRSFGRLDSIQVQVAHSDAVVMVLNPLHEVNSHFSTLPYSDTELKSVSPKVYEVMTSLDVLGGPTTTICAAAFQQFVDANPIKTAALAAAMDEANRIIATDRMSAAKSYIEVTHERFKSDRLADLLTREGVLYSGVPTRTMLIADQMFRTGLIKRKPVGWTDYHFAFLHDRAGS